MPNCSMYLIRVVRDFPGGPVVRNPPSSAGDVPGRGTHMPHSN